MTSSRWALCLYLAAVLGCSNQNSGFSAVAGGAGTGTVNFAVTCPSKPLICITRIGDWDPNAANNHESMSGDQSTNTNRRCRKEAVTVENLTASNKSTPSSSFRHWEGQISLPAANYMELVNCHDGGSGSIGPFSLGPGEARRGQTGPVSGWATGK
ncbi:MAG: hypothetical protein FJ146_01570 [Deltaproteobacteria bacterium]|nr:hypothetical protein [Deltaproteobacteria bacterium]